MNQRLTNLMKEYSVMKRNFMKDAAALLKMEVLTFIKSNPEIEAVRWQQYTPYFNDGEPCTFRVYDAQIRLKNTTKEEMKDDDGFRDDWNLKNKELQKPLKEFNKMLRDDELLDVLEDSFGDHVRVTVTTDNEVTVEDIDHD